MTTRNEYYKEEIIKRIANADRGHNECYYYVNGCMKEKRYFLNYITENASIVEYAQEKANSVDAFGNPTYIQLYHFYAKSANYTNTTTEGALIGKTIYFTKDKKDLAQTLREEISAKEDYIDTIARLNACSETYIGYQKGVLEGLKQALKLIE